MSDKVEAPSDELDVLKLYVWVMLVMSVALSAGFVVFRSYVQDAEKRIAVGERKLIEFATTEKEIVAMLNVYKDNDEDQARSSPYTWFQNVWRRSGIPDQSVDPGAWDNPPRYDAKGKFYEENIRIGIENRNPLKREQIAKFCHEIERASTRLRILQLDLKRANKKEGLETDEWSGRITIGYRKARITE